MIARTDFRQHLQVETPEHVVLDYEIAGLGSRALATIIDTLLLLVWLLAVGIIFTTQLHPGAWLGAAMTVISFASIWGYFTFFEGLRRGQTPGKRRLGIRVVQDTGHAVTFGAAALRNLLRVADFLPPPYLLGALFVGLHPRGKRLGDLVAGTVVVRDRPAEAPASEPSPSTTAELETTGVPELTDEEFRFLREYAERAENLPAEVRARLAGRLTERLAERFPSRDPDPVRFVAVLYRDELARRRGRFGGRSAGGERRQESGGGVAERLVARKSRRWEEFQVLADRAATQGLDSFAAAELPDFAARYREIAADLARARTYRAQPPVLARLERLVAAGHNALYRDERRSVQRVWRFIAEECPAGVIEARRTVLLGFLTFLLPGIAGFMLLREQPALADQILPQVVLERAEAGTERQRTGRGYYEADAGDRPMMASSIMTNNISVAFNCFASGIFAGVGSLVLLGYNGLAMGAISGHFANHGLLGYLWTFVIGHGVLELFAIWVSGAAGFLLGRALIAPGDLTRGEALVIAGRLAARMIGAVVLLLVVAGLIEGFVSASTEPLGYRVAVSGGSLIFLLLYLANGWMSLARRRTASTGSGHTPAPAH